MEGGWKQFCWMGKRWKVEALSLMMAHYLRHSYQATANRALSTSFPFLSRSLSFPSLACPSCFLLHPDFSRVVLRYSGD